jgi:PIN domain nuclease of toxin-antitoxin system
LRYLLDTHIWLWSLIAPEKLSRRVRSVLEGARNEGWLSPVSVWEVQVLAERGRVKLDDDPRRWVREAVARTPLNEAILVHEIAMRSRDVALPHEDPADRFLIATALVYELTFVTADQQILDARPCPLLAGS